MGVETGGTRKLFDRIKVLHHILSKRIGVRTILAFGLGLLLLCGPNLTSSYAADDTGYAVKRPIIGGACKSCPWGALADIVKAAMAPYGYDVQVCYNCAGSEEEVRIVSEKRRPPPLPPGNAIVPASLMGPPPNGVVDFGVTQNNFLQWQYHATGQAKGEPPRDNIRLVANLATAYYLTVAVRADLGISDLSELKGKPVKILWDDRLWHGVAKDVLAHYGITKEGVEAAGGAVFNALSSEDRHRDFDVAIFIADLSGTPEFDVGYDISARNKLKYLTLPDELLSQLASKYDMTKNKMPVGYFLGVDRAIPTVTWNGNSVYGRTDMPDDFAYTLAKALYEQQSLLDYGLQHYSYHPQTVWKVGDVPLHPGAAKFYREMGFMK